MNKYGLYIVLFALLSLDVSAQVRRCQIVQEFIKPVPYQNIYTKSYEDIELKITNLGPDTIFSSDNYSMFFKYGGIITFPDFDSVRQMVPPNAYFIFTKRFYFDFAHSVDSVAFCSDFMLYSLTDTLLDADSKRIKNNRVCVVENFVDTAYKVKVNDFDNDINAGAYPNPFTNYLQLNYPSEQIKLVKLIDIQGRTTPIYLDTSNRVVCDFNGLDQGYYFLILEYKNGTISTQKLFKL